MRASRGQALVLFALTLLLLTLMVMITLSLGAKVRSRMELQTVADAAAYSNAVATARTFNAIAVLNRVHVAQTVSTIGTLSLISWATKYWRHVKTARDIFLTQLAIFAIGVIVYCLPPPPRPACGPCKRGVKRTGAAAALLALHASNTRSKLRNDTVLFRNETTPRWRASQALYAAQGDMIRSLLVNLTTPAGSFAAQLAADAQLTASAPLAAPAAVNTREVQEAAYPDTTQVGEQPYHAAQIVMGTRGHPFIPRRSSPGWDWSVDITIPWALPAGLVIVDGDNVGRGYLNQGWTSNPTGPSSYGHPYGSYAHDRDDHTRTILATFSWWKCTGFGPLAFAVGAIGRGTGTAKVGPWDHPGIHDGVQHSYQTFPPFWDFNPRSLLDGTNLYGQPKNVTVMSRDVTSPSGPWDLNVGMKFSPAGARLDMVKAPQALSGGRQLALGAGVTYYSRPDHYSEPPNLFAPFWRSTLTRFTVDRPGAGDVARGPYDARLLDLLDATGQSEASTAFKALQSNGYLGFQ